MQGVRQTQRIEVKGRIRGLKRENLARPEARKFVAFRSNSRPTRGHRSYSTKLIESSGSRFLPTFCLDCR